MSAARLRCSAALALAATSLLGSCGPAVPPPTGAMLPPSAVIRWAVGPEHRGEEPPLGYRYLLALPSKPTAGKAREAAKPVLPGCFEAMAFLPAPEGDPRFFFLREGAVLVSHTRHEMPVPLAGNDPARGITRLLAFARHASPLGLLVAAMPGGTQEEQLWLLAIGDRAIESARQVTAEPHFSSQEAFFERFDVPRCLTGGRSCLVASWDGASSFLDIEPVRGQPPRAFQELGGLQVIDATWAPDGEAYYVLVPCHEKGD
ncbi:hypothetical protein ACMHYB_14220 [Sorangium sp. So ce1128]